MNKLEQDVQELKDKEQAELERIRKHKIVLDQQRDLEDHLFFTKTVAHRFSRLAAITVMFYGKNNTVEFKYKNQSYFIVYEEHEANNPNSDWPATYTEKWWVLRKINPWNNHNEQRLCGGSEINGKEDWYPDIVKALKNMGE